VDAFRLPPSTDRGTLGRKSLGARAAAASRSLVLAIGATSRLTVLARIDVFNETNAINPVAPETRVLFTSFGRTQTAFGALVPRGAEPSHL
jgi:hypothetical protein